MSRGVTLIELMIVIGMLAALILAGTASFPVVLTTWSEQDDALMIQEDLKHGGEKMIRELRAATAINVANDAIRFTERPSNTSSTTNDYIFYLYHASDSWIPSYNQDVYQLRKATLTGGINGTFTYGDGPLYMKRVKPPTTSDLSASGNVITIDLTVQEHDETFRLLQELTPRNL
jgi:prepilin-type N-terminal cleavage/methylation domain-containing protein